MSSTRDLTMAAYLMQFGRADERVLRAPNCIDIVSASDQMPRLIGIDWGTSSLRAYLLGEGGAVLAHVAKPWGVMSVPGRDFAAALYTAVGDWRAAHPGVSMIASGMIGSTEGWVRAPYCACPAGLGEVVAKLVRVRVGADDTLSIVPGVEQRDREPNVMRGEETQVMGTLTLRPELCAEAMLVLPGTHSKWVAVRDAKIVRFETFITGELYALLADQSILGRPARAARADSPETSAPNDLASNDAFDWGVRLVRERGARGVGALLFLTRSLVLTEALRPEVSLDFLSGLVIGEEVRSALPAVAGGIALIGDPVLVARYARALRAFGIADPLLIEDSAPAGLWRIACAAGLVASTAGRA